MHVGVLTGLRAEARLLRVPALQAPVPIVAVTGGCPIRARREAERLVSSGAVVLVSFGLAGGLDPRLEAGDVILADRVILPDGRAIETDRGWLRAARGRVRQPGAKLFIGPIAGTDRLLATIGDKQRLAERSGALAGDLESAAAAAVAEEAELPLLVVRAVSDSAVQPLPHVARVAVRADGRLDYWRVAQALCAHPREWPQVARLAVGTRAALLALRGMIGAGVLLPPVGAAGEGVADEVFEHELRGTLRA